MVRLEVLCLIVAAVGCINGFDATGLRCDVAAAGTKGQCPPGFTCDLVRGCQLRSASTGGGSSSSGSTSTGGSGSSASSSSTGSSLPSRPDAGGLLQSGLLCANGEGVETASCSGAPTFATLGRLLPDGGCLDLPNLANPSAIAVDPGLGLWVAIGSATASQIVHLDRNGAGSVGPLPSNALFTAIAATAAGQAIVADQTSTLTVLTWSDDGDGGSLVASAGPPYPVGAKAPRSLAYDSAGQELYLADGTAVYGFSFPSLGPTLTFAASCGAPEGVAVVGGRLLAADRTGSQIYQPLDGGCAVVVGVNPGVQISTQFQDGQALCGNQTASCGGPCAALCAPIALASVRGGHLAVLDSKTTALRDVDLDAAVVRTVFGAPPDSTCACAFHSGVANPAGCAVGAGAFFSFAAQASDPLPSFRNAVAGDAIGDLFIADPGANQIKVLIQP